MRGRPVFELAAVLLAGGLIIGLLINITIPSPALLPATQTQNGQHLSQAWSNIRLSHPASKIELHHGQIAIPLEAAGPQRFEGAIPKLILENGLGRFQLEVEWADTATEGYAEIRIEPDYGPAQSAGFWGHRSISTRFELQWPNRE